MTRLGSDSHLDEETLRQLSGGGDGDAGSTRHLRDCEECTARVRMLSSLRAVLLPRGPEPCPDAEVLAFRSVGAEIAEVERIALDHHLTSCLHCTSMLERLAHADGDVGALPRSSWLRQGVNSLLGRLRALVAIEMPTRVVFATRSGVAAKSLAYGAGMAAYMAGDYDAARAQLAAAESEGEKSSDLAFYLGVCELRGDDSAAAIGHLRRAVRSDAKLGEYRWYLAQALLMDGQAEAAARELKRAATLPGPFKSRARDVGKALRAVVADAHG